MQRALRALHLAVGLGIAVCAAAGTSGVARAEEPTTYTVDAELLEEGTVVTGTVTVPVRVGASDTEIALWLYADRLAVTPRAMDSRNARWVYEGQVDLGGIRVTDVRVNGAPARTRTVTRSERDGRGRDVAGSDLVVALPSAGAGEVVLSMGFRLRIPERFGRIGNVGGVVSLLAPWYPVVVAGDAFAFQVPQRVRLRSRTHHEMVICGDSTRAGSWVTCDGPYAPVVAAEKLFVSQSAPGGAAQTLAHFRAPYRPAPKDAVGEERLDSLVGVDVNGLLGKAITDVRATMATVDPSLARKPLTVVTAPLRTELATAVPGMVVVSDRVYDIFPMDVIREFHQRAVRRAMFRALEADRTAALDTVADRGWAADLRASALLDLDLARRHGVAATPRELLGFASFHPAVDQLLYAPQVSFLDVYFGRVDEPDPFRDEPARARVEVSRGRRILESARDVLTPEELVTFVQGLLSEPRSARAALYAASPTYASRVDAWVSAAATKVNYRLGAIASRQVAAGFEHRIEVLRDGDARVEPVEVAVVDDDGHVVRGIWHGAGPRGWVTVRTKASLDNVYIDPRGRLPQSLSTGNAFADDALTQPWRPPLLRAFGLTLLASEQDISGFVNFAMRRQYDLTSTFDFTLSRSPRQSTGIVRFIRSIGPKLHDNARIAALSAGVRLDRLDSDPVTGEEGAWRPSLQVGGGVDTRVFFLDPREGYSYGGTVRVGPSVRDDGEHAWTGSGGVRGSYTLGLGLLNAFVFVAGGGWTFGDALTSERQSLGGPYTLRGYETTELVGDGAAFAVVEHRFTAFRDMEWNLVSLGWLREIQLAAFAGAGVVFRTVDGKDARVAAEVGGGVRFHFEYGGVQPGVFSVDVAVPLLRDANAIGTDGVAAGSRIPVGMNFSFDQYF